MNGIIQTAIANPRLRLELVYRVTSPTGETQIRATETATGTGMAESNTVPSQELACRLKRLQEGETPFSVSGAMSEL